MGFVIHIDFSDFDIASFSSSSSLFCVWSLVINALMVMVYCSRLASIPPSIDITSHAVELIFQYYFS